MGTDELRTFNPMESPDRDDPNAFYGWARNEQPVSFAPAIGAYLVSRYDDIRRVLDDPGTYSSKNAIPSMWDSPADVVAAMDGLIPEAETIVNTDEPAHAPLRGIVNHAMSGRRIRRHIPAMQKQANALVDRIVQGQRTDLVHEFSDPYVQFVISLLFGVPAEDIEKVQAWTDDHLLLLSRNPDKGKANAARRLLDYQDYMDAMAEDRRHHRQEDFMSDLVHGTDDLDPVSREDLHYIFRGLRLAGHDTTMHLITTTVLTMLGNGRTLWEQAKADRSVLPRIIEEVLRHNAPHRGLMRVTTRDVTLAGTDLPAGTPLLLLFGSANHDETRFATPAEVTLDRPNITDHLAFGGGIHQCPGAQLARTEVRVAVDTLLDRLPDLELVAGYQPSYVASYFFRGLERLDVTW